ncbi:MAG: hypothetical protein DMF65_04515 [Acidobacteria bacterium]|nr:MAG: hypothetical protein DMF65_04515 [Acidobacteriota bacterium]
MQKTCPSCGAETFPGARFCRRCGGPLRDAVAEGTGDVSPQAATVPLGREQARTTDGLAPGDESASAETSRVSRAEMERLLRAEQDAEARGSGSDPAAAFAQFERDVASGAGDASRVERDNARGEGDNARGEHDEEATLVASSAATRPEAPAFAHDEELTVTVPRPVRPLETHEASPDFGASQSPSSSPLQYTTRDAPAFEPTGATAPRDSAPFASQPSVEQPFTTQAAVGQTFAQQTQGGQAQKGAGAQAPVRTRRRWPVVVAVCAAVLLFTVAAAWLAFRFLRRPSIAELPTQAPTAIPAPDVKQQFDEKLAQAEAMLAQGNMDGAQALLREANALDTSNTRAHRRLGELLLASGARRDAIEEFRAVTRNAPEDFTAWRQLATAQFAEGLYRDAAESYRRLVSLVGEQSAGSDDLLSYADALRLSGRADDARAIYQRLAGSSSDDVAAFARQRLAELAQAQPVQTPRPGEQAETQPSREGEAASLTQPGTQTTQTQPTPTPQPTPQPTPARHDASSPAEHYQRGVELWSSNRAAAFQEFQEAAGGGNVDANYYLGLFYVEGKDIHSLNRAAIGAALRYFQIAERGQFAAQSRRYAQQLEKEFDRLHKQ